MVMPRPSIKTFRRPSDNTEQEAQLSPSIEILPIATQQCRNYLYDKSCRKIEVMKLEG